MVVAGALLGGCGGSGGDTTTSAHADLVEAADASCQKALGAAAKIGSPGDSVAALNGYAAKLEPAVEGLVAELEALSPAPADEAALEEFVEALRGGEEGLRSMASAGTDADAGRAAAAIASEPVAAAARRLGAKVCAKAPT